MKDPTRTEHRFRLPCKTGNSNRARNVRFGVLFLLLAAIAGCNGESPTAPRVPPQAPPIASDELGDVYGTVWGQNFNTCLVGATIEVLDGPEAGQHVEQSSAHCLGNDGSGAQASYRLKRLQRHRAVRIRASMPGFQPQERSAFPVPTDFIAYDFQEDFVLTRSP